MKYIFTGIVLLLFFTTRAQKKVVIMGSSTALGNGASSYANAFAGKLTSYYNQNTSDGVDTTFINLAYPGYSTYELMPSDFIPPSGKPAFDPLRNITKALSYLPDVILINLPNNDMAREYTKKECMDNFRLMFARVNAAGVRCFITTSQLRNDLATAWRDSLHTLVDSINNNFGLYSIDFWTDLVTTDGLNYIKPAVSAGDGIHINDAGHNYLFIRARDKNIFSSNLALPLSLKIFKVSPGINNAALLKWLTVMEEPNTVFHIQRSTDGLHFQTVFIKQAGNTQNSEYNWTDENPGPGKHYYRLLIKEGNTEKYSPIASIVIKAVLFTIKRIAAEDPASLQLELQSGKSQSLIINITDGAGRIIHNKTVYVNSPVQVLSIPTKALPAGIYYLTIYSDSYITTKAFRK